MKRNSLYLLPVVALAGAMFLPVHPFAQGGQNPPKKKETKLDFQKDIVPIVKANCISCHNKDKAEHNVMFPDKMTEEDAIKNARMWRKSMREVKNGQMPPKGKDGAMSDSDRKKFIEWIDAKVPVPARPGGGGGGGGTTTGGGN